MTAGSGSREWWGMGGPLSRGPDHVAGQALVYTAGWGPRPARKISLHRLAPACRPGRGQLLCRAPRPVQVREPPAGQTPEGGGAVGPRRLPPSPPPPRPRRHPREGGVPPGVAAVPPGSGSRPGAERLRSGRRARGRGGWAWACGGAHVRGWAPPYAPRPPRPRRPGVRPPGRGAGARRPSLRTAAARTHRALGRQVADVLDGADVDDVDAAVLGRECRVLLVDPHRGRLCARTAGRRALPIHGPGGLCKRTGSVRGALALLALLARRGPGLPLRPPPSPSPSPSPPGPARCGAGAPTRLVPRAPRRLGTWTPAGFLFLQDTSAVRPPRAGAAAPRVRFSVET